MEEMSVLNYIDSRKWDEATKHLCNTRETLKTLTVKQEDTTRTILNDTVNVVGRLKDDFIRQPIDEDEAEEIWKLTAECFRVLRTCCVYGKDIQLFIAKETGVVDDAVFIIDMLIQEKENSSKESAVICIRCGIQFLGNLVTQNGETGQFVWDHGRHLIEQLLHSPDKKVASYSSLVLLNIISQRPNIKREITQAMILDLLQLLDSDCEFGLFCIEELLCDETFIETTYLEGIDFTHRKQLLEILHSVLARSSDSETSLHQRCEKLCVPVSNIKYLVHWFKEKSDVILKTCECDSDKVNAGEVALTLEVLTAAASLEPYTKILQVDKSLLLDVIYLLKAIHDLGKADNNFFSKVEKASEFLSQGGTSELNQHPAFGFKANLVRIIGSLCWKNHENQCVVLENEAVPVILDCCSLDARNPFITQCSILTLKALCEGNTDIQNVIAGMNVEGGVHSEILAEFGLGMEKRDGKIVITRKST